MNKKETDCTSITKQVIENVRPNLLKQMAVWYLSGCLRVMEDNTVEHACKTKTENVRKAAVWN
ncbi:hypothetical protein AALH30_00565 [Blautia pseudococcoides]|uniref:hypothetical protein n=1 Tax=Blautia pseudococcoides TaxID=1796616 RepID=UPI00148B2450|nr:hypothetical protein [Blautia pseudococcoides]QJU14434.1 hypothetical protein HL650_08200 [Blautia pseudococcoides]